MKYAVRLTIDGGAIVQLTFCVCQWPGGVTVQVDHIVFRIVGPTTRDVQVLCRENRVLISLNNN